MPLPFLAWAIIGTVGAVGVGTTVKAGLDQHEANERNDQAESIIRIATNRIDISRKKCNNAVNRLGEEKVAILDGRIKKFVEVFEKIHNIELEESVGLNEYSKLVTDKTQFGELKKVQLLATSIAGGMASGSMAGAVTAFGAYSAAGAFATASTGTAIASLSGAAATNATLAFFGGGSIASGGLGIAGGTMVLGGLVAAPALAVMGVFLSSKASANLDKAYSNLSKAREYDEQMKKASEMCNAIRRKSDMFSRFLVSLDTVLEPLVYDMAQVVQIKGTDYSKYDVRDKKLIAETMALVGAVKSVIDTPILNKDGSLINGSELVIEKCKKKLNM